MPIDKPLVSVCIPVRNGASYINEAISSVLEQHYQEIEIVIIDNFSSDSTAELVQELAARNSKIKFYKNNQNIGLIENFNACINKATGKYVKFLCADDFLLPGCLERMVSALESNDSATLVTVGRYLVNENGKILASKNFSKQDALIPGKYAITRCLFGANYIGEPSATMYRRETLNKGFNIKFPHLVDLEMWFRLLEKGDLISISRPFCAIRRHEFQMTQRNIQSDLLVEDNVNLFETYKDKPYINYTFKDKLGREMRMAYRIWMSRKYIQTERKKHILKLHSNYFFYYFLMPVASLSLKFFRNIKNYIFSILSTRSF